MLADGRFEDMKSLFGFYFRMLDVSKARTKAWFGISGTFFPETKQQVRTRTRTSDIRAYALSPLIRFPVCALDHTQSGIYDSGGLGWGCKSASPTSPIPGNTYIRYHREGGLELSLLAVDWLEHSGDLAYFQAELLPQITAYTDYYAQHFKDGADGKLDMFPAQALETVPEEPGTRAHTHTATTTSTS